MEGLIFGEAHLRRANLRFKTDWASLISTYSLRAIFQVQPLGGLYLEGRFNGGFFALPVWGAYIWRGLYMEGLILGILRCFDGDQF